MHETLIERLLNKNSLYAVGLIGLAVVLRYLGITPELLGEYASALETVFVLLALHSANSRSDTTASDLVVDLMAGRGGRPPR